MEFFGLQIRLKRGQILVYSLIFLTVSMLLSGALFSKVTNFLRFGSNSLLREQTVNLAEAGVDRAIWQLNETVGGYSGETDTPLGNVGTFSVTVTTKTSALKTITATGFVPNSTNPKTKTVIKVDTYITSQPIAFRYATQTDTGGLEMKNNSKIFGSAYSNGSINGTQKSTINGDAYAVGTITSPDPFVTGTKQAGAPSEPMPEFDAGYWKNQANIKGDPNEGDLTFTPGTHSLGPKKIEGNLTLNSNSTVTLKGPIHVTGNFTMKSNSTLDLDPFFESAGTVVVVDGTINLESNTTIKSTNATPKGYILLASTKSAGNVIQLKSKSEVGIIYALVGTIQIEDKVKVAAAAANKLVLETNASLTYDSGLASAQFSAGPGGSWVVKKGTYRFTKNP